MELLQTYGKEIVALLVPLITWIVNNHFKARPRLHYARPHQFTFLVQQPLLDSEGKQISSTQSVNTNSYIIRNDGRESAAKVELVFNWKPMCLNLWPMRHYEEYTEPDKRYVLIFDSLAPNELIGIEVLAVNTNLPELVTVRSAQCIAQSIQMYPQPVVRTALRRAAILLMALGLATSVYIAIVIVQLLVLRTPLGH